jgi:DNA-binding Lrp family transcriptional regulator
MTPKEGPDATDIKILELLREDSRLSFREIGKRINLSTGTVSDRVKQMIEDGVIKKFTTTLDPLKMGLGIPMFIRIRISSDYPIEKIMEEFKEVPEACCINYVTGDLQMITMVRCTDNEHATSVLDRIRNLSGVDKVESNVVLKAIPHCDQCWCGCGLQPSEG